MFKLCVLSLTEFTEYRNYLIMMARPSDLPMIINEPLLKIFFLLFNTSRNEQTPLNRSQQLPAPYKELIDGLKQN